MVALMGVGLAIIPFGCRCSLLIFGLVCTPCEMACFLGFAGLTPRFSRLPMEAVENADLLCLPLGPGRGTLLMRSFAKDWIPRPYPSKVPLQGVLHFIENEGYKVEAYYTDNRWRCYQRKIK